MSDIIIRRAAQRDLCDPEGGRLLEHLAGGTFTVREGSAKGGRARRGSASRVLPAFITP